MDGPLAGQTGAVGSGREDGEGRRGGKGNMGISLRSVRRSQMDGPQEVQTGSAAYHMSDSLEDALKGLTTPSTTQTGSSG